MASLIIIDYSLLCVPAINHSESFIKLIHCGPFIPELIVINNYSCITIYLKITISFCNYCTMTHWLRNHFFVTVKTKTLQSFYNCTKKQNVNFLLSHTVCSSVYLQCPSLSPSFWLHSLVSWKTWWVSHGSCKASCVNGAINPWPPHLLP